MAAKKRSRKAKTTVTSKAPSPSKVEVSQKRAQPSSGFVNYAVPPKKRKTGLTALESIETECVPDTDNSVLKISSVPEWLKVSIQVMLLNFHHEGVALLNSIESEFEDMFRSLKVNPGDYGFEDWEEMLKSPQFKKHFFMYTDKKMMYVKGLPLPRSGTITLRNNVWELDPKVDVDLPQHFQEPAFLVETTPLSRGSSTCMSADMDEELANGKPSTSGASNKSSSTSGLSPAPRTSGRRSKIFRSEFRLDPDFLSSTRVKPSVMSKLRPEVPDEDEEDEDEESEKDENDGTKGDEKSQISKDERESCIVSCRVMSPISDEEGDDITNKEEKEMVLASVESSHETNAVVLSGPTEVVEIGTSPVGEALQDQTEMIVSVEPPTETYWDNNFFRRSDVPEEWTKTRFADDEKSTSDKQSIKSHEDEDFIENDLVIDESLESEDKTEDLESPELYIVDPKTASRSPSPPPPKLHRMDILPRTHDPSTPKEDEKTETAPLEMDTTRRSFSVIRTISQLDENGASNSDNSTLNSPTDSDHLGKAKSKIPLGVLDPGVLFFPWKFRPWSVGDDRLLPTNTNQNDTSSDNPDSKIDSNRDPRLTRGFRSRVLEQGERLVNCEVTSKQNAVQMTDNTRETETGVQKASKPSKVSRDERNLEFNLGQGISSNGTATDAGVNKGSKVKVRRPSRFESLPRGIREVPVISTQSVILTNPAQSFNDQHGGAQIPYEIPRENVTVTILCHPGESVITPSMTPIKVPAVSFLPIIHDQDYRKNSNVNNINALEFQDRQQKSESPRSSKESSGVFKSRWGSLRNPIPDDGVDSKSLTFEDLWKDAEWKNRFHPDKDFSNKFFSPKVLEKWKETKRKELTPSIKHSLISELQTYENKPYPSRCEYYCRSSLRMVEVDYLTGSQFSEPRNSNGQMLVQKDEVLFYVDFAGAPGGVAEFYSKKRPWGNKGFGITHKKKFYDLNSIPDIVPQYFEAFYGTLNSDSGDGSLFSEEMVNTFVSRIRDATKGRGVHVVTTIGNLSRVFEENNDKIWKYQHLAQVYVGLKVLREDGNMVFKMYDIKSAFTAALLYFMYKSFKYVEIIKLDIFAPGSDEKAVICLGRRSDEDINGILKFLGECHQVMSQWYKKDKTGGQKTETIGELIPLKILEERTNFMEYLKTSNDKLKNRQTEDLILLAKNLKTYKSIFTRAMYRRHVATTIERWNVGSRPLYVPSAIKTPSVAYRELKVFPEDICEGVETLLNEYNLYSIFSHADPWKFVPIGKLVKTRGFYLGVDNCPHFFDPKYKEWIPVKDFKFSLPSQTLVYAQIVSLHDKDSGAESTENIFAIIDALYLAGKDIRHFPYKKRMDESTYFCAAITRVFYPKWLRLTVTEARSFSELPTFLHSIKDNCTCGIEEASSSIENSSFREARQLSLQANSVFPQFVSPSKCFHPSGVLFFETSNGNSTLDFCATLFSRVCWKWVDDMDLPLTKLDDQSSLNSSALAHFNGQAIGSVSAKKLIEFVNRYS